VEKLMTGWGNEGYSGQVHTQLVSQGAGLTDQGQALAEAAQRVPLDLALVQAGPEARRHQGEAHPGEGQQGEEERDLGVLQRVVADRQARQHRQAHHVAEDVRGEEQRGGVQLRHQQRLLQRHGDLVQQVPPQMRGHRPRHSANAALQGPRNKLIR